MDYEFILKRNATASKPLTTVTNLEFRTQLGYFVFIDDDKEYAL